MARLTTAMTPEQMDAALQAEPQTVRVSVTVPAALEEDFRRMAEEWLHAHRCLYGPGMPGPQLSRNNRLSGEILCHGDIISYLYGLYFLHDIMSR